MDLKALRDHKGHKVRLDLPDLKVIPAILDLLAQRVILDHEDQPV